MTNVQAELAAAARSRRRSALERMALPTLSTREQVAELLRWHSERVDPHVFALFYDDDGNKRALADDLREIARQLEEGVF